MKDVTRGWRGPRGMVTLLFAAGLGACSGTGGFDQQRVLSLRRVAVLSVVIDDLSRGVAKNRDVLRRIANHALGRYQQAFGAHTSWEVRTASAWRRASAAEQVDLLARGGEARVVGAIGLPAIAYESLQEPSERAASAATGSAPPPPPLATLGALCRQLDVDGLLCIHLRAAAGHTGEIQVIGDHQRTLGHIMLDPTLVLVSPLGERLIDFGFPTLDDRAPMKWGVPLFAGAAGGLRLDLNDPDEACLRGFLALVDSTCDALVRGIQGRLVAGPPR